MKRTRINQSTFLTILSITVLSIFVFMGGLTWGEATPKPKMKFHPDGTATETIEQPRNGASEVTVGKWDSKKGIFVGEVTISYTARNTDPLGSEVVSMKDGKRHGKATYTDMEGNKTPKCYRNGEEVSVDLCDDGTKKSAVFNSVNATENSTYDHIVYWFAFKLNAFGFDANYMNSYLDTLELLLYDSEFGEEDFDDYYEEVIDTLRETSYDSIIQLNESLSFYNGLDLIATNEFRQANIDNFNEGLNNIYQVVKSTYTNYLLYLNSLEVTDPDFEGFCSDYDSIMSTYVPLTVDNPALVDSLDERMYRTLSIISAGDEEAESTSLALKSAWSPNELRSLNRLESLMQNRVQALNNTPQDIADLVLLSFLVDFLNGDLIKAAVVESFSVKKGIVQLPTVVTNFSGNTSSTSVMLSGNVIKDGGGEISSRGMAWASIFNPTISNQVLEAGSGTGEFEESLTGLSEGETYFARAYATNSAGTAYGNCISFVAGSTSGIDAPDISDADYRIYPNPATDHMTVYIKATDSKPLAIYLYDMSGKVVLQEELTNLDPGDNQINVNLSEIESGSYVFRLKGEKGVRATKILLISR